MMQLQGTISVPMPPAVKTSSSSACGIRPSIRCTFPTPSLSASTAERTFGNHSSLDNFILDQLRHIFSIDRWNQASSDLSRFA